MSIHPTYNTIPHVEMFNQIALHHQDWARLWVSLTQLRKCFMCSVAFPEGIVDPHPSMVVSIVDLMRTKFLLHIYTSHGIDPSSFRFIFKKALIP